MEGSGRAFFAIIEEAVSAFYAAETSISRPHY
jgi:hypothetical protein